MQGFTPIPALAGGILIGLSASLLLLFNGKVCGISGIAGGLLSPARGDVLWRAAFVGGLLLGGLAIALLYPAAAPRPALKPTLALAAAGLLVGFGTRLGNGCTSGHGVCGISRLSPRSLAATGVFMLTGAATVYVALHVLGGAQ